MTRIAGIQDLEISKAGILRFKQHDRVEGSAVHGHKFFVLFLARPTLEQNDTISLRRLEKSGRRWCF
jgi:hypothetical protein